VSWFCRRRRRPDATLRNLAWTPAVGDEIDRRYAPQIEAWDEVRDTLRQDYSGEQWLRYQVWVRVLDAGLSWKRLEFARHRITTGRCSDGVGGAR
jgi:hypothetical protein